MNWYLVYTKVKEEDRVEKNLSLANLNCYIPKLMRKTTLGRSMASIIEPLFPRYVFVRTKIEETFWKIKYTRGVVGLVDFGYGPVMVNNEIIDNIRRREKDGFIELPRISRNLKKNDRVTIQSGVLKNIEAVFDEHMSGGDRVVLLLNNVSSNIKLNISERYL